MVVVRYAYALALALWLGGLPVLGGLVAPALFGTLRAHDTTGGTVLAGAIFGSILHGYLLLACGAAVVLLICLAIMRLVGPRPVAFGLRAGIVVIMLALGAYTAGPLSARLISLQQQAGGSIERLAPTDARRVAFDQAHGLASALLSIGLAGAFVLLYWDAREPR